MRVTNQMMNDNALRHINENQERMYALQEKVSSTKQFQRASDNPVAATSALGLRSNLEMTQAYLNTANGMESWFSAADFSLRQVLQVATRAMTLAQEGRSDTQGASERQALGGELDDLLHQAVEIANTSHQGSYLFAGLKTTTVPFTLTDTDNDKIDDTLAFHGDSLPMTRSIGPGQTLTQNVDGQAAFLPLLTAIKDARDHLLDYDQDQLETALASLTAGIEDVNRATRSNGAHQRDIRLLIERNKKFQIELKSLLSQKEDVNMAEAISDLQMQETTYRAVLEVGQRTLSAMNLFDLLR